MDKNKRRGFAPLAMCILILSWAARMRGFENVRVPIMLTLFFAGVTAGAALMHFLGLGNRHQANENSPRATTQE